MARVSGVFPRDAGELMVKIVVQRERSLRFLVIGIPMGLIGETHEQHVRRGIESREHSFIDLLVVLTEIRRPSMLLDVARHRVRRCRRARRIGREVTIGARHARRLRLRLARGGVISRMVLRRWL
jgi:hypothetical protein